MDSVKTVVVFGAGFIGKNLIKRLIEINYNIRIIDPAICPVEFQDKVEWYVGRIDNIKLLEVVLRDRVDCVFHLLSGTVPGDGMEDILKSFYTEMNDLVRLVELCVKNKVNRFVFASSSSVYGRQEIFPIPESALTNPISAHGILKLTMEKYIYLLHHIHNFDVVCVRISNPYGPGQDIKGRQGFIAILIGNIKNNTPVLLRNNGQTIRDFIHIDDLTRALVQVSKADKVPCILNLGTGTRNSLQDIVLIVEKLLGREIDKKVDSYNESEDIPVSVLDIASARKNLNFNPLLSMEMGLRETLRHHNIL